MPNEQLKEKFEASKPFYAIEPHDRDLSPQVSLAGLPVEYVGQTGGGRQSRRSNRDGFTREEAIELKVNRLVNNGYNETIARKKAEKIVKDDIHYKDLRRVKGVRGQNGEPLYREATKEEKETTKKRRIITFVVGGLSIAAVVGGIEGIIYNAQQPGTPVINGPAHYEVSTPTSTTQKDKEILPFNTWKDFGPGPDEKTEIFGYALEIRANQSLEIGLENKQCGMVLGVFTTRDGPLQYVANHAKNGLPIYQGVTFYPDPPGPYVLALPAYRDKMSTLILCSVPKTQEGQPQETPRIVKNFSDPKTVNTAVVQLIANNPDLAGSKVDIVTSLNPTLPTDDSLSSNG